MPVFGYLAYPEKGSKQKLLNDIDLLDHCEVMAAENEEILILVTDTPNDKSEKALQKKLKGLNSLQALNMTFGHSDV